MTESDRTMHAPSYLAGERCADEDRVEVFYPYDGSLAGTISRVSAAALEQAVSATLSQQVSLSRYERSAILQRAAALLAERAEEFAESILRESGLCLRETRYEVGRAQDVLRFAAIEALKDDGQIFSCDVSPQGKPRKIFTLREPHSLVLAITPFNHPLNQVAHKIAPAIAAGAPILLKPSEKTPLTAVRFAELLYEAGLPGPMLSVFLCDIPAVLEPLIQDPRVPLVTFTGGTEVGKRIASMAGYKRLCLELGGNSPLLILPDADLDLAATLAAEGCYRNSGQRCTAVKRVLVDRRIVEPFTERFVELTKTYRCGDPANPETRVGCVIDEAAARLLERRVELAVRDGARVLCGGKRQGALLEPTVIADVPRDAEMVCHESFGPLAPLIVTDGLDDAIAVANGTVFGLAAGVVTNDLDAAIRCVRQLKHGTVNVNQMPGFRIESSPFGGIKDSGLGIKEGVIEAIKFMTWVKTFSLPWG